MYVMTKNHHLEPSLAGDLAIRASKAFRPRSPINTREFFAGRWEQLTTVADAVSQTGLHIIVFGERGVGKTSLANVIEPLLQVMEESLTGYASEPRLVVKVNMHDGDGFADAWARAFDEIAWVEDRPVMGFGQSTMQERITLRQKFDIPHAPSIDNVRRALTILRGAVFIFDEFDRGSQDAKRAFTDLMKALSDYSIDVTLVIVGVANTIDELVRDHASIVRSIVQIQLPRMNEKELQDILVRASNAIDVEFSQEAGSLIVRMSQGLPHYTHLIGLHATREAVKRLSGRIELGDVRNAFPKAVNQAVQSIREKHMQAIHSAHKDALYGSVVLACAIASSTAKDALGFFRPADVVHPLSAILNRKGVKIATFQKHINELCEETRGPILERAGVPRAYRYRFRDPLMPPYVFMTAMATGVDVSILKLLTVTR